MPYEDIEVRITRRGEIFVKIEGATEERVRDYFLFLQENVGAVKSSERIDRPDWERPAGLGAEDAEEEKRREQEIGY